MNIPNAVQWCSMFCTGNEATGELNIETEPGVWDAVPICEYCVEVIEGNPGKTLDTLLQDMIQ